MKLNLPTVPEFRITPEEFEIALRTPVTEKHRFGEITIQPEGERPRLSNRILVHAYRLYMEDKPMEFASMMKALFLHLALGKLVVIKDGMTVQLSPQMLMESTEQNIEDFDGFDLSDLTVDMNLDLPDDYSFGSL
jgi:hypothetical protein